MKLNKELILYVSWGLLGFKRGINSYDYKYNKNKNKEHNYTSVISYESYMYSYKICHGGIGVLFYMNPFFIFMTIPKEIYRLEVNIRNMEKEKKGDYYNELW